MNLKKYRSDISFNAIFNITRTASVIYFFLGLAVYISNLLYEISKIPAPVHHHDLEPGWMLAYLYTLSILFLAAILWYLSSEDHSRHCTHSHGSAFVRQGAVIFGLGSMFYTTLEILTAGMSSRVENSSCHSPINSLNPYLLLAFIILQVITVILHPRLNLRFEHGLSQMGLMHLILTNAIMWIRTIIKESLLEFYEVLDLELERAEELYMRNRTNGSPEPVRDPAVKNEGYMCYEDLQENYPGVFGFIQDWTPTLFPFIIEFSLIGCTMFLSMWSYVHVDKDVASRRYSLNPRSFLKSLDFTHSWRGFLLGLCLFCLNLINLILFFEYSSENDSTDEFISKCSNSIVNFCGSAASILAIFKIQQLKDKEHGGGGMDAVLLYISGAFLILYSILEILVGTKSKSEHEGYSHLQTLNGVFSVTSTVLQIVFINLTFIKGHEEEDDDQEKREIDYPGRQETVFLSLVNLSQWLIFTFEIQKTKSSRTEAEFFGPFKWVILQRIIMPLSIFFRFHSTVILVDSWKNNYPNNKKKVERTLSLEMQGVTAQSVLNEQTS